MNYYLDKTLEINKFILYKYKRLNEDGILVINYTGSMRNPNLYHILEWYISYENSNSKLHFDNRHFEYYSLIKLLNNNSIEYINNHISIETIKEQFKKSISLKYSCERDFETISKFYIATNVQEKVKVRKLTHLL